MAEPALVIVDLREPISIFSKYPELYFLYQRYPLHDIIQTMLMFNLYDHKVDELFWLEVENRFYDSYDNIDLDNLSLFYELTAQAVDECIRIHFPPHVDSGVYIFDSWVNNNSVLLKRDSFF